MKRMRKFTLTIIALLTALTLAAPAFAEGTSIAEEEPAPGVYALTATPYYAHPITGVMEDSGQNPGIGQGMTESVLGEVAQLEVTDDGRYFITMRFSLMDNINDCKLYYQPDETTEFTPVDYSVTKEDMAAGQSDLSFEVPELRGIVKAAFYVVPMGRDVVFFMTFSDPVPGETDFVVGAYPEAREPQGSGAQGGEDTSAGGGADTDEKSGGSDVTIFIVLAALIVLAGIVVGILIGRKKGKRS